MLPNLPEKIKGVNKSPRTIISNGEACAPLKSVDSTVPDVCSNTASSPASAPSPAVTPSSASALTAALRTELEPAGFECHPLLIGWYNAQVAAGFRLPHPADTLAIIVISTPDMFERCFVPHVRLVGHDRPSRRDPLDSCMRHVIGSAAKRVHESARVMYDFELGPTRRPRVLVQTAGHVSGAVRLYRRQELNKDPWPESRAVMGVCLHPEFGGWFALRALVVLEGVETPGLPRPQPPELLTTDDQKREVIELFNFHWRDCRYRDVCGRRQYSALQREYFSTPPGERQEIVERIIRGEVPTDGGEGASAAEVGTASVNGRK